MCATLGLALTLVLKGSQLAPIGFILPVVLYFWYTFYVLRGLRVFKYVLRGISHASVGRYRPALLAFRRALQLDPSNRLASAKVGEIFDLAIEDNPSNAGGDRSTRDLGHGSATNGLKNYSCRAGRGTNGAGR